MKKLPPHSRLSKRSLRLEALENREMLSATPIEVASLAAESADFAAATLEDAPIDLSSLSAAQDVTFARTDVANQFKLSWAPIDGAASYNVKISRDNGSSWYTYAKPTDSECLVNGLHLGKNYSFQIFAVNAKGKAFGEALQGEITPTVGQFDAGITFTTTQADGHTISWNSLNPDSADSVRYVVQTSKDDGATWLKYRETTETSLSVSQQTGTSRLYRVVANGQYSAAVAFSPLTLQASAVSYVVNQKLDVAVKTADNVAYSIKWYNVEANGDVEITEAANLTSYTPTNADSPIKVVVEQEGGANQSSFVFATSTELFFAADSEIGYDPLMRSVDVSWQLHSQAVEYRVYKKVGDGNWVTNAKFALNGGELVSNKPNQEASVGFGRAYYEMKMLEPDQEYAFKVNAIDSDGKVVASEEFSYTPIGIYIPNDSYDTTRRTRVNTTIVTSHADVRYQWQFLLPTGGEWSDVTNSTQPRIVIEAEAEDVYRLVVTAYDDEENIVSVAHAFVHPRSLPKPTNGYLTFPSAAPGEVQGDTFSLTFNKAVGVENYEIQFASDVACGNYITLRSATYTDNGDGTATFTHDYGTAYDYANAWYRIRSSVDGFVSEWVEVE